MPRAIETFEFSRLRPRIAKALADFTPPGQGIAMPQGWRRLDPHRFPVPEMLLILLREVMGMPWSGFGEKVRWTVYFDVKGKSFAVELAKFGLRLYGGSGDIDLLARVMGQLEAALGRLEKAMQPYAEQLIFAGEVTLVNRSSEFRSRYEFFRTKAQVAYRSAARTTRSSKNVSTAPNSVASTLMKTLNNRVATEREGFFYSVAMVDAYFSYLEHQLVLLRAFTGEPLANTTVPQILAARWDEKLRLILKNDIAKHAAVVGDLRDLKERIRNPFAHGGSENDAGSIYFFVPRVGAIPGNMSRTKKSAHFKWIPIDAPDYERTCATFDALDTILSQGRLERPHRLIDAGIDPAWDSDSLAEYRKLNRESPAALRRWIDHWGEMWARHANMDY